MHPGSLGSGMHTPQHNMHVPMPFVGAPHAGAPHAGGPGAPHVGSVSPMSSPSTSDVKIKLYNNSKEREHYDNLADLFSIIKTTEHLEKALMRDSITAEEYNKACSKLIAQFKTARKLTSASIPEPGGIRKFCADFKLEANAALERLEMGVPGTVGVGGDDVKKIAETVQHFITAMDSLKLNMVAVDELYPLLSDIYAGLSGISKIPADFEGIAKIKKWLTEMNKLNAHDELSDGQVRQLLFDLDSSYSLFHTYLG